MSITLAHDTSPEQAEAAIHAALAASPGGVEVRVHGFPREALDVIVSRLPDGATAKVNAAGTRVKIKPAIPGTADLEKAGRRPFTVQTYNAYDRGTPERTTFIHVTERPPKAVLQAFAEEHGYGLFYPSRGTDAFLWDESFLTPDKVTIQQGWQSGRDHGQPGTTPDGFVLTWRGTTADGRKVGFVGSHLVNNAFGPDLRGERALRRKLWRQGWGLMRNLTRELRGEGYDTFRLGDLNRRSAYWSAMDNRSVGDGYDRIIPPKTMQLLKSWRGDSEGSDHRPLIGQFRAR